MTTGLRRESRADATSAVGLGLRVAGAALLGVSAFVHVDKAHIYDFGSPISGTDLFYGQGAAAALVALWLLVRGSHLAWLAAGLVGAASFGAVMLYRYVDVGALGPLPNMYDPIWYAEKTLSAVAEAAVAAFAALHFAVAGRALFARRGALAGRGALVSRSGGQSTRNG